MTRFHTTICSCRCRMEAVGPAPDDILRCSNCGRAGGCHEGSERRDLGILAVVREELGSLLKGLQPEDLTCPACGAMMAVALRENGDKTAVCPACGRETTLTTRHGRLSRLIAGLSGRRFVAGDPAASQ